MKIFNAAPVTDEKLKAELDRLSDAELVLQEIAQKAALHALQTVRHSPYPLDALIASVEHFGAVISAECRRRGVAVVDTLEI